MSRLSRNIAWNLAGQLLLLVLALLAVRLVFRRLGADVVGLILFTQTVNVILVSLLELGIVAITVREVAAHFASDRDYVGRVLQTAALFYWGGYLVLAAALLLIAPFAARHWINLTTLDPDLATALMRVLGLGSLLLLPRSLYASLFRGLQRMAIVNLIEVGAIAFQQAGILLIVIAGAGVQWIAAWIALSYLASLVAYIGAAALTVGWRSLLPAYDATVARRNARFSLHMVTISTLGMLHSQSDKLAVSKLMAVGVLGTYAFAATVVGAVGRVTLSVVQAAFPSFADLAQRSSRETLLRQYRLLQSLVVYGTAPLFAGMAFAALPTFTFVFNREVAASLLVPVVWLCLGFYMNGTLSLPYYLTLAMGKPEIPARQNLLAVGIVLPVVVASVAGFGLAGAAFSWVFYHLFAFAYAVPRICHEVIGMAARSWYAQVGRTAGLVLATYGVATMALLVAGATGTAVLAIGYLLATAGYGIGAYLVAGPALRREWDYAVRPSGMLGADAA